MQLEITEIEVTYTNSTDLREAEADENNELYGKVSLLKKLQRLMNSLGRREEAEAKERQKRKPKSNFVSEAVADKNKGRSASKIAAKSWSK